MSTTLKTLLAVVIMLGCLAGMGYILYQTVMTMRAQMDPFILANMDREGAAMLEVLWWVLRCGVLVLIVFICVGYLTRDAEPGERENE
jgi:hypothetical protein